MYLLTNISKKVSEQYKERLDTVEQQAKTEIAAYFDHAVHKVGIEALRNPKLLGGAIDEQPM
jgi:hypothetical protein